MTTHVTLQFNDGDEILLSTSSFLFKHSKLFQAFDIEEDNTSEACADVVCTIPILCSKTYVTENNANLFDNKPDLSFMFTLQPNKFLDVCRFLDIICYENEDTLFSDNFITYVMTNTKEEINIIKYFMQPEIRSIMNYINKEDINIQIRICTREFYALYLTEYKEEVIKHNRIDLYELSQSEYYRYIHKYDNHLTLIVKETQEYNNYIIINEVLVSQCKTNNIEIIKLLVENGANVNFQDKYDKLVLHYVLQYSNNLKVIQYLIENGANVNLQDKHGNTALFYAVGRINNLKVIQYLVENGANVNLQNNNGYTALHCAAIMHINSVEIVQYLVEHGANVNLKNNYGKTALDVVLLLFKYNEIIKYLQSIIS